MNCNIKEFVSQHEKELLKLHMDLCRIPAPSHFEHKRAEFCKNWFDRIGAANAFVDALQNVILPINCENSNEITVFAAHIDTVFPDLEPMEYFDDGEKIHCPGCGSLLKTI